MQSSDAFLKLHASVSKILDRNKVPKEINAGLNTALTYDQLSIPFNLIAKMRANEYIEKYGLSTLRQRMILNNGQAIRHCTIDYISKNSYHELTHTLIWNIYNALQATGTDAARELFSIQYKDALTGLHVNTAFEIACRLLGLSFSERESYYDYKFRMPMDLLQATQVITMVDLIDLANIRVNHESITLAMLPFVSRARKDYPEYGMPVQLYLEELERYNQFSTAGTTARTIFMKLSNTLKLQNFHLETFILPFTDADLLVSYDRSVYSQYVKHTCRALSGDWRDGDLSTIVKKFYHPPEPVKTPERWTMASFLYRTLDWIWRMRMQWNGDYRVGIDLTIRYGKIFGSENFSREPSFTYTINRYILEALGQTWIGLESMPIDRKCTEFRKLARSYYAVTVASIEMLEATGWYQIHNPSVLLRKLEVTEELPNDLLLPLVSTLAASLPVSTNLSNFHVLSAMIFYAKHVLKDFALQCVEINNNISPSDILDWINYE